MEFRQIQFFISIVDTGSFSMAAEEHYISQSSLSKQIIALEKELGVQLFDRRKRKVALTEAGAAVLEHARKFDAEYKAMLAELDSYKPGAPAFSIAAIPVIAQYGITTYIAQFRNMYPNINFTLVEVEGLNILPALDEHRCDLAFTRHNYLDTDHYASLQICRDRLLVVASKRNWHAMKSTLSLEDLSADNFIVFDKVTILHKLIMEECGKAGFTPTIFYSSLRIESIFGLVASNIGIALMPEIIFNYYQHPDVLAIPLVENIESNIVLVYLKNKRLPKSARLFVDLMKTSLVTSNN